MKKLLTLLLTVCLVTGLLPAASYASETDEPAADICTQSDDCTASVHEDGCPKNEELSDADSVHEENAEEVQNQILSIENAMENLTEEEQKELETDTAAIEKYETVKNAVIGI
ncbi:MAG: hypothetical protein ACOX8E_07765 [Ruminococcus sp.]